MQLAGENKPQLLTPAHPHCNIHDTVTLGTRTSGEGLLKSVLGYALRDRAILWTPEKKGCLFWKRCSHSNRVQTSWKCSSHYCVLIFSRIVSPRPAQSVLGRAFEYSGEVQGAWRSLIFWVGSLLDEAANNECGERLFEHQVAFCTWRWSV